MKIETTCHDRRSVTGTKHRQRKRKVKERMIKWSRAVLGVVLSAVLLAGCGEKTGQESTETSGKETQTENRSGEGTEEEPAEAENPQVEIQVKDYGKILVELEPEDAPETVGNFLNLTEEGFYDGLTFHRIIDGFMIQGGDPQGNGTGGSDKTIKGEFSNNGVDNPLSHTRGAVSMARSQDMDSASSQFFIVHQDSTYLDGDYAVFGYVTEGMEIVDQICEDVQAEDGNGTVSPENQPVIESVKVTEN